MHPENKIRAKRIWRAATGVEAYSENREDPAAMAADMLTDLRHFCDLHALPFHEMDSRANKSYLDEIEEPQI
jgi:hypothetical protein